MEEAAGAAKGLGINDRVIASKLGASDYNLVVNVFKAIGHLRSTSHALAMHSEKPGMVRNKNFVVVPRELLAKLVEINNITEDLLDGLLAIVEKNSGL